METFELEEYETVYSETEFAPAFSRPSPSFSYGEFPRLPNGTLILALEFMDRYRAAQVPGVAKWAGMVHIPVIDGHGTKWMKLVCLYWYGDRMFGLDPTARFDYDRRFAVPIPFQQRTNPDVLFQFAVSFVERVFPGGEEEIWIEETTYEEEEEVAAIGDGYYETLYIDAGRIAPLTPSQAGKQPEELVYLLYQYQEANTEPLASAAMGPPEKEKTGKFSWSDVFGDFKTPPDPVEVAQELVHPRWGRIASLSYEGKLLGVFDRPRSLEVLLFNVGKRIYLYDPEIGTWRSDATLEGFNDLAYLRDHLTHPSIKEITDVEILP